LRIVVGHTDFAARRDVELVPDGGRSVAVAQGAEQEAGDVGEGLGAAGGDASAGEEFEERGESVLDLAGVVKVAGILEDEGGKVLGVGDLRGGVAGAEVGARIEDVQGAAASCGSAVLAALGGASFIGRRGVHGRSFLEFSFLVFF
jgi:hypothetical protein